jgi:hypothetical protein
LLKLAIQVATDGLSGFPSFYDPAVSLHFGPRQKAVSIPALYLGATAGGENTIWRFACKHTFSIFEKVAPVSFEYGDDVFLV